MYHDQDQDRPALKEYGQSWEIAAALWDEPKTLSQIVDHFYSYIRLLGLYRITKRMGRRHAKMAQRIEEAVEALLPLSGYHVPRRRDGGVSWYFLRLLLEEVGLWLELWSTALRRD